MGFKMMRLLVLGTLVLGALAVPQYYSGSRSTTNKFGVNGGNGGGGFGNGGNGGGGFGNGGFGNGGFGNGGFGNGGFGNNGYGNNGGVGGFRSKRDVIVKGIPLTSYADMDFSKQAEYELKLV